MNSQLICVVGFKYVVIGYVQAYNDKDNKDFFEMFFFVCEVLSISSKIS